MKDDFVISNSSALSESVQLMHLSNRRKIPYFNLHLLRPKYSSRLSELVSSSNSSSRKLPTISSTANTEYYSDNNSKRKSSPFRYRPTFRLNTTPKNETTQLSSLSQSTIPENVYQITNRSKVIISDLTGKSQTNPLKSKIYLSSYSNVTLSTEPNEESNMSTKNQDLYVSSNQRNASKLSHFHDGYNISQSNINDTSVGNIRTVNNLIASNDDTLLVNSKENKMFLDINNISFYEVVTEVNKNVNYSQHFLPTLPFNITTNGTSFSNSIHFPNGFNDSFIGLEKHLESSINQNNLSEILSSIPISPARLKPANSFSSTNNRPYSIPSQTSSPLLFGSPILNTFKNVPGNGQFSDFRSWKPQFPHKESYLGLSSPAPLSSAANLGGSSHFSGAGDVGNIGYLSLLATLGGINSSPDLGFQLSPHNFAKSHQNPFSGSFLPQQFGGSSSFGGNGLLQHYLSQAPKSPSSLHSSS